MHVRLDVALGAVSIQRAALDVDDEQLVLHLWPGELKAQAEHLYAAGHAERLCELAAGDERWRVEPQPLLGFRNAPKRTRVYLSCTLDALEYARRWQGEDWSHVGSHHRQTIRTELWPWLLQRGYASPEDAERLDPFLHALGRRFAHLRPGIHVSRSWSWEEAQKLDDDGLLAGEIRDAIDRVLAVLGEPPLQRQEAALAPAADTMPRNNSWMRSSSVSSAWNATASILS